VAFRFVPQNVQAIYQSPKPNTLNFTQIARERRC